MASVSLLNLFDSSGEVVYAIRLPVQRPELRLVDSVEVMLLGILGTRVVGQVNIKSHLGDLEGPRLVIRIGSNLGWIHGEEFSGAAHSMLDDNGRLGDLDRATFRCARNVKDRQRVAVISMNRDALPSYTPLGEVGSELRIGFNLCLSLGLGASDECGRADRKSFTEHGVL